MSERLSPSAPAPAREGNGGAGEQSRSGSSIGNLTLDSDDYYDDFSLESASEATGLSAMDEGGESNESPVPKDIMIRQDQSERHDRSRKIHKFCKFVPKIELHAHVGGCIRESTLIELAKRRGVTLSPKLHPPAADVEEIKRHDHTGETRSERDRHHLEGSKNLYNRKRRSLLECFEIFAEISKCVVDLDAMRRITSEMIEDFALENVAYLELRSTPKCLFVNSSSEADCSDRCTKKEYVQTVFDVMEEFEREEKNRYLREKVGATSFSRLPLVPRFLMSVDRSGTSDEALENVMLAIELYQAGNPYIVGVELGGNPTKNDFSYLEPALKLAKDAGLRVSIHCGEVPCGSHSNEKDSALKTAFEEAMAIVQFRPDRLGQAMLLPDKAMDLLLDDPIPIECCPTSNVMTLELAMHHGGSLVEGMKRHPLLQKWLSTEYPISINTDDSGVFETNSTRELLLLAKACHLNEIELGRIILGSLEHVFEPSEEIRLELRENVQRRVENITRLLNIR